MSQNNFFKGLSLLILLNVLVKPVWIFFVDRQVQNLAGHEAYGSYFSVFSLALVLSFIADAGISHMMNRQIALSLPTGINQLFNYKVALSAVYLAVFFLVCYFTGIREWKMVMLVALIQVMNSFVIFFRSAITAAQQFRTDSWVSVLDKFLVVIFLLPFLYLFAEPGPGLLYTFLYVQAGSLLLTLTIAGYFAGRGMPGEKIKNSQFREVLQLTLPFILLIGFMGVHNRLDMFLLERLHEQGAAEAGVYAAAYRLLDAGNMLGYLSASFLVPFAAKHLQDKKAIGAVVVRIRHALLNVSLTASIFCFFFAGWVVDLLYHTSDPYYQQVLWLCLLALPAYMMIHVYGSLLTAAGAFRDFITIVVVSVALNLVINLIFIRSAGALACVYAALASQYLLAALCYIRAVQKLRLSFAARPFVLNLLYAVVLSLLFYVLVETGAHILVAIIAATILSALIMFVQTKMLKPFG